jgi:hypothetical protein
VCRAEGLDCGGDELLAVAHGLDADMLAGLGPGVANVKAFGKGKT